MYHVLNYLLTYCDENYDKSDDAKELLNEVIIIIFIIFINNNNNNMFFFFTNKDNTLNWIPNFFKQINLRYAWPRLNNSNIKAL